MMMLQRIARLGAEAADAVGGVVAAEGSEVHAGDGAEQPRGLRIFLDSAAGDVGGGTALDGAGVDAQLDRPSRD